MFGWLWGDWCVYVWTQQGNLYRCLGRYTRAKADRVAAKWRKKGYSVSVSKPD